MNNRLEGWQLALAVLLPAIVVAAAIWFALQAVGDSGSDTETADEPTAVPTSTATPAPVTEALPDPTPVPSPTPLPIPTPLPVPTATTAPEGTPTPDPDATATPDPDPAPTTAPSGPPPTATPDPDEITITCSGADEIPDQLGIGEALPQLSAAVSPPERAPDFRFRWTFGGGMAVSAPNSGTVSYDTAGTYTIDIAATDTTTGEVTTINCGTVTVGDTGGVVTEVSCQVRPTATGLRWEEATINDTMQLTTTWTPTDTELNLQYEFNINDPIIFSNGATSGDGMIRVFQTLSDTVKIFWRNPATGETGRTSCRAFPDPSASATATPSYNNVAAG